MNCLETRDRLAAFLYGDLPSGEIATLKEHLAKCSACQKDLASLRKMRALLDNATAPEVEIDLPRVYSQAAERQARRLRRWRRAAVALTGIAALLLLTFLVRLEVRVGGGQLALRWGSPAEQVRPQPSPRLDSRPPAFSLSEPRLKELDQEVQTLRELIYALKRAADGNDGDQSKQIASIERRLSVLQKQSEARWQEMERDRRALYLITQKGE